MESRFPNNRYICECAAQVRIYMRKPGRATSVYSFFEWTSRSVDQPAKSVKKRCIEQDLEMRAGKKPFQSTIAVRF